MSRNTPTVKQDERAGCAESAQIGAGVAVVIAVRTTQLDPGIGRQVIGAGTVGCDRRQQLFGAGDAGTVNVLSGDDLNGKCTFILNAFDTTARDFDLLYLLSLCRRWWARLLRNGRSSNTNE